MSQVRHWRFVQRSDMCVTGSPVMHPPGDFVRKESSYMSTGCALPKHLLRGLSVLDGWACSRMFWWDSSVGLIVRALSAFALVAFWHPKGSFRNINAQATGYWKDPFWRFALVATGVGRRPSLFLSKMAHENIVQNLLARVKAAPKTSFSATIEENDLALLIIWIVVSQRWALNSVRRTSNRNNDWVDFDTEWVKFLLHSSSVPRELLGGSKPHV